MEKNKNNELLIRMGKFFHPINIYNNFKSLYFAVIPKGSKLYNFTYSILHVFLKRLHLFNIYYQEWIRRFDTLSEEDLGNIKKQIQAMPTKPILSVVMPVYNPPVDLLGEAIQSVLDQVYPFWELCIADDASTNPEVIMTLKKFNQEDDRIKVVFREENGHISAASNSALELVSNDFFALLDHDDKLHPLALFCIAETLQSNPNTAIIYTDEDKITRGGRRLDPYFKPDFNYELLLSQNMISHLGVYRTKTVREIGGFRVGFEGSQDYDLALRVMDSCNPHQIRHIPRPLYHWRIFGGSAARNMNVKPYAIHSGIQALKDHLQRKQITANIEFLPDLAAYEVQYTLPKEKPDVDIILLANQIDPQLKEMLQEIVDTTDYPNYQITLGLLRGQLNRSHALPQAAQNKIQRYTLTNISEEKFANAVNEIVASSQCEYICLLDKNLSGFKPGWLKDLMGQAIQQNIGVVAPRIIYLPPKSFNLKERVFSNGVVLLPNQAPFHLFNHHERTDNGYFGWGKLSRGYSAVSEKCMVFKRDLLMDLGGFDRQISNPFYCGSDFCLKLREKSFRNILRPAIELYIQEDSHYNNRLMEETESEGQDLAALHRRWGSWFRKDPAFNPNLTIVDENKLLVDISKDSA